MIVGGPLRRPIFSVRSQVVRLSTRWDVAVGVALVRPPIVAPPMSETELVYQESVARIEHERSLQSEFELRLIKDGELLEKRRKLEAEGKDLSQLDEQIGITAQQLEQDWARNAEIARQQFELGNLAAVEEENTKSIRQHLDRKLILLVKQRFGEAVSPWILPQLVNKNETLRQTVERCLGETLAGNFSVTIDGSAPISVYKYRYPKPVAKKCDAEGSHIFFFSAYVNRLDDEIRLNSNLIHDYRWCTSDELMTLLPETHRKYGTRVRTLLTYE